VFDCCSVIQNGRSVLKMHRGGDRTELGFCALHNRRRKIGELCPLPGQPGKFRCLPQRECYQRDGGGGGGNEMVVCSIHGKRRAKGQCLAVSDGVYECLPAFPCHTGGMGQVQNRGLDDGAPGERPTAAQGAGPADRPVQSNFKAGTTARPMQRLVDAEVGGAGAFEMNAHEVWCARHGKKLPLAVCEQTDATYFACRDAAVCTSGSLEPVPALLLKGCNQLVCAAHGRVRRSRFMALNATGTGYNCVESHACVTRRSRAEADIASDDDDQP
jgi:hypothetical protein